MRLSVRLSIAAIVSHTLFVAPAMADDETVAQGVFDKDNYPLETIHRPLTLVGGMLSIQGDTFRMGLNGPGDNYGFAKPMVLAPDILYGINGQLTVGLVHTNRFGALLPAGFCVSGTDGGCYKSYNATGAEAIFALTRGGNVGLAFHGGLSSPAIKFPTVDGDEFLMGLDAGLMLRGKGGKIAVVIDPSVYINAIGRDFLKDYLFLPIDIQYQLNPQTMVYLSSGLNGPFKKFGDSYQIPAGLGANFAANNRIDFGAEFEVENLAGKEVEGGVERFDFITFIARLAIRI
jgi:hypothetical protein